MMRQVRFGLLVLAVLFEPFAASLAYAQLPAGPRRVAAQSLAELRTWDSTVDRMGRSGELRIRQHRTDPLLASRTHDRLDQYHRGVRVYGGDVARQMQEGVTTSLFGTIYEDITIDPTPTLSAADARAIVMTLSGADLPEAYEPEVIVLPRDVGLPADAPAFVLAYRGRAFGAQGLRLYFIDAHTGALLLSLNDLQSQAAIGTGQGVLGDAKKLSVRKVTGGYQTEDDLRPPRLLTFDLKKNFARVKGFLNGTTSLLASDLATDTDNLWTDGAVVDAHVYGGWVYDFFYKRFGRRGLDDANLPVSSIVHPVDRATIAFQSSTTVGTFYMNAFYAGEGIMVFGEGLPGNFVDSQNRSWNYTSGALDVFAHELTHGVTDFSSRLLYLNESGALNEAFSDMMGVSAEFYYQKPGGGLRTSDYTIGEDVVTPGGLRSLSNPGSFGDPDHYSRRYLGTADNGGVHTNSAIPSHAFYLAIEGGTNRTSGLAVAGVGGTKREQIEKVFYRAFTQMLPANASFSVARAATVQAARDLYGADSAAARAVTDAWAAVGVN
jgi:bacillolysin